MAEQDLCIASPLPGILTELKQGKCGGKKKTARRQPIVLCLPRRREEAIRALEEDIRRERRVADQVVQAMPAAKQEKYFSMMTANEELLQV